MWFFYVNTSRVSNVFGSISRHRITQDFPIIRLPSCVIRPGLTEDILRVMCNKLCISRRFHVYVDNQFWDLICAHQSDCLRHINQCQRLTPIISNFWRHADILMYLPLLLHGLLTQLYYLELLLNLWTLIITIVVIGTTLTILRLECRDAFAWWSSCFWIISISCNSYVLIVSRETDSEDWLSTSVYCLYNDILDGQRVQRMCRRHRRKNTSDEETYVGRSVVIFYMFSVLNNIWTLSYVMFGQVMIAESHYCFCRS